MIKFIVIKVYILIFFFYGNNFINDVLVWVDSVLKVNFIFLVSGI